MKKITLLLSCYLVSIIAMSQTPDNKLAIIPQPVNMVQNAGYFQLPENISIEAPELPALQPAINFLKQRLTAPTGYKISISAQSPTAAIRLVLNKSINQTI